VRITTDDNWAGFWVSRHVGKLWFGSPHGRALGWYGDEGEIVAGVTFTNFDGANVWMDCAAEPGTRWLDRRGLWAIFHYVFEQLGCVRCSVMIPENNDKSLKLVQQAGFKYEATLERAAPEGKDMLIYRMFKEDCRWLGRK
jgi:RimJ/RimL family protein N-acetyltransferase